MTVEESGAVGCCCALSLLLVPVALFIGALAGFWLITGRLP